MANPLDAFARIAGHFANLEMREASAQVLEAGEGLQVVIRHTAQASGRRGPQRH